MATHSSEVDFSEAFTLLATLATPINPDALPQALPWVGQLHEAEKHTCIAELAEAITTCAATGNAEPLLHTLLSWKSTAEAYALGLTAEGSELDWFPTVL